MRKQRLLVALLAMACAGQVRAQTPAPDDDRDLTGRAARVLLQLPADQRDAFTQRLATMTPEQRRAALRELVAAHGGGGAPDMGTQLQQLWNGLPAKERQRLLGEAMKNLKQLPPEQQRAVLDQVRRLQQKDGEGAKANGADPSQPPAEGTLLRRALGALDKLIAKHGEEIESTVIKLEEYLGQGREYLQMYRGLPEDQRQAVLTELEDGLRIFLEENVMPEVEQRFKGLKELRQESSKIGALAKEYLDMFRKLPAEEREQIAKDLVETGKLFFEETIRPEIEKLRKMPRDERRKKVRDALRKLFD